MKRKYKSEHWLIEVFPGRDKMNDVYEHLSGRELVIVASAVIDVALANLISLRCSETNEVHKFLGVDDEGQAPASTLDARIQLAHILGIIDSVDIPVLMALKGLRNKMAHRVQADWLSKEVQKNLEKLFGAWEIQTRRAYPGKDLSNLKVLRIGMKGYPHACDAVIHSVLVLNQSYFHFISERIVKLNPAIA